MGNVFQMPKVFSGELAKAPMAQAQGHSSLDLENQDTAATELIETTSPIGDGKPR